MLKLKMGFAKFIILIHLFTHGLSCSLSSVYKDIDRQLIVREQLKQFFESKYTIACGDAYYEARYLLPPAAHFKKDIEKLFVEYGEFLNNYQDLEIILKSLNYLKNPEFESWKEEWDKNGNKTDILID